MKEYFVSYSKDDEEWAEWIAWELDALGCSVIMQKWDFLPGSNFVCDMHTAIQDCRRLILILSNNSLKSQFVSAEWASFFAKDPKGEKRLLIPVRIDSCEPDGLLGQIVYIDLHNQSEESARKLLHVGIGHVGPKPVIRPLFPGLEHQIAVVSPKYPLSEEMNAESQENAVDQYPFMPNTSFLPSIRKRSLGRSFVVNNLEMFIKKLRMTSVRLSVIVFDVDGMTRINANYGVDAGDSVIDRLFVIAERVKCRVLVGRMGDDALFVLIRNVRSTKELADQLVKDVGNMNWNNIALGMYVHCSAGVAEFRLEENAFDTVVRAIEGAKLAKRYGGNRAMMGPQFLPVKSISPTQPKLDMS